jgi:hypothetical protein
MYLTKVEEDLISLTLCIISDTDEHLSITTDVPQDSQIASSYERIPKFWHFEPQCEGHGFGVFMDNFK